MLQIGEVAHRVGLSLRTLRHWDEVGLVVPSARSAGGFRLYTDDDMQRLLFVKSLKPVDLSLDQIRDLVQLIDTARVAGSDEVRDRLALYRAATDARIDALRTQLQGLELLADELRTLTVPVRSSHPARGGSRPGSPGGPG